MKSASLSFGDDVPIDRGRVVALLDELDHHVAGEAHGDGYIHAGRLAAVLRVFTGEMFEQEPRADLQFSFAQSRMERWMSSTT